MSEAIRYRYGCGYGSDIVNRMRAILKKAAISKIQITYRLHFSHAFCQQALLREVWHTPALRRAFRLGIGLQALQQLSGINTIM